MWVNFLPIANVSGEQNYRLYRDPTYLGRIVPNCLAGNNPNQLSGNKGTRLPCSQEIYTANFEPSTDQHICFSYCETTWVLCCHLNIFRKCIKPLIDHTLELLNHKTHIFLFIYILYTSIASQGDTQNKSKVLACIPVYLYLFHLDHFNMKDKLFKVNLSMCNLLGELPPYPYVNLWNNILFLLLREKHWLGIPYFQTDPHPVFCKIHNKITFFFIMDSLSK